VTTARSKKRVAMASMRGLRGLVSFPVKQDRRQGALD
jgi:hypothetical protein